MECKSRILVVLAICILVFWAVYAEAAVIRVKSDGNDNYDGSTWALAKQSINSALGAASSGDEIWVAAGTSYSISTSVPDGVSLYGGFEGTESSRDDRDWATNLTIVTSGSVSATTTSGEIAIDGFKFAGCGSLSFTFTGDVIFSHNILAGNTTPSDETPLITCSGPVLLANNLIYENSCRHGDSFVGIKCLSNQGSPTLTNNTISNNGRECALAVDSSSAAAVLSNNIIRSGCGILGNGYVGLVNNCVYCPCGEYLGFGIYWTPPSTEINANPLFVDSGNDNYHLASSSPCIDAGEDTEVSAGWVDLDNGERKVDISYVSGDDIVDIGAYEFAVIYVKTDGDDEDDGYSWNTAKDTVDGALDIAQSGDEVWVAAGTYDYSIYGVTMPAGVMLLGGFVGTENSRDARDWATNVTSISYFEGISIGSGATVDGFNIYGGISCSGSSTFSHNILSNSGMYGMLPALTCSGDDIVANNLFAWNTCISCDGSAIFANNTVVQSNPDGKLYAIECADYSSPTIANNIVAFNAYGGIRVGTSATPTLSHNCVYDNNDRNYSGITPTSDINVNPLFVNIYNSDYHLASNSPCIDAGDDNEVDEDWLDLDCNFRQVDHVSGDTKVDIGAYEYPDTTAPSTPVVTDDGDYTSSCSSLHAIWTSSDLESGIVEYQYAIGTTSGGTDVLGWTSTGTTASVTKTGLSLTNGQIYYFTVKAKNGQGDWSSAGNSDGIIVGTGLRNGNFEEGLPGDPGVVADYWNKFTISGTPTFDDDSTYYHSASYSQKLTGSSWTGGVYQIVSNIAVGASYTASVWVMGENSDVKFRVGLNPYGCTDPTSASTVWSNETTATSWTQIEVSMTSLTQSMTVFVKAQNTSATPYSAYIDDAALERDSVHAWHQYSSLDYRREVVLNPSDSEREDVPLFVRIQAPDGLYVDTTSVTVDEITTGTAVSVDSDAWAQPSGKVAEVYFTATGTTQANTQRRFFVYYDLISNPVAYSWSNPNWGSYEEDDRESPEGDDYMRLESDVLGLERSWNQSTGKLRVDNYGTYSKIERLSDSWSPVNGFHNSYTATSGELQSNGVTPENLVSPNWQTDSSDTQVSLSFSFSNITPATPLNFPTHSAEETYRLIKGLPWCEFVMNVSDDVELLGGAWDPKTLYFNTSECGFDYMVSNKYTDQSISSQWYTDIKWLVVYDHTDENKKAVGWYMFKPGCLRTRDNSGTIEIFDTYEPGVDEDNTYRYLWVLGERDSIVDLFESMGTAWSIGEPEGHVTIAQPKEDDVYVPGDNIPIDIWNPFDAELTARWDRPTLSDISVALVETETGRLEGSYTVQSNEDWGIWTLEVLQGETVVASKEVEVLEGAAHPHVMFSQADVSSIQARKNTTHINEWTALQAHCNSIVNNTNDPLKIPTTGTDIRRYGNRLLALALAVKVDPAMSSYEAKMWEYFWTMLRYPNWYDDSTTLWYNNYQDLMAMHSLLALAIAYDWHYDKLDATERQEVRHRLVEYTKRSLEDLWQFDLEGIEYDLHNHIWIDYSGLAAIVYALEDEMDETLRSTWNNSCEDAWDRIMAALSEDGSNPEGVGYDCYGLEHLNRWVEMRRVANSELGYEDDPWFDNHSRWLLYSMLPGGSDNCGGFAPIGDSPQSGWNYPMAVVPLLARHLNDPIAQWLATELDQNINADDSPLRYLWYDPTVDVVDLDTLPNWACFKDENLHNGVDYSSGIFVWRSSWDNDATYFSLKCGRSLMDHAHPDTGSFILHRADVPYIVDYGYCYKKMTADHNVLLLEYDSPSAVVGQYGEGNTWFSDPENPGSDYWGSITQVLATGESENPGSFFDVVCNPTPAYNSDNAHLEEWTRECVGLGDLFLVRDTMEAEYGYEPEFQLFLHSFKSQSYYGSYEFVNDRLTTPWSGTGPWTISPRQGADDLDVIDLSEDTGWSGTLEAFYYVPGDNPNGGSNYPACSTFQFGGILRRDCESNATTSLVALCFDDETTTDWTILKWSSGNEGVHVTDIGGDVLDVLWPDSGSCTNSDGWTVTGTMTGRRYSGSDSPAFFAREATSVIDSSTTLLISDEPVSLYARMEHTPSQGNPNVAKMHTDTTGDVTLLCTNEPTTITLDGNPLSVTWNSGQLMFELPAGEHVLRCY